MSSTVLVTGATGKTGRRLIPKLLRRGIAVRAGSRAPVRSGAEPVRFDWFDESTYQPALQGADALYLVSPHLADNVVDAFAQIQKFLHSAADAGVRRLVHLSSFGVDQAPADDPLRRVELLVDESAIPATILRPAAFMQNFSENHWSNLARTIRERGEVAMPFGDHPVSYVSTADMADVAAVALAEDGHEGRGYTLTGPAAITLIEAAELISAATGRHIRYVDPGPGAVRQALLDSGAQADFAEYVSQIFEFAITSGVMTAVTGDVAAVTGREPTGFAEFATDAVGAWLP
ncbi:NmrA family NAD(P)-binding protein [Actinocrispum wychmicini]|uniref:NmrA family NAD(P)-binding protein n=1 Tax=Actinocrispum wychmicini TaxID=1213861 RepID=UPI00140431F5|nr:NAD(P)H-binding protein [Actinocrispum wychmicini]